MATITVILQDEKVAELEHKLGMALTMLREVEQTLDGGEVSALEQQQMSVAIKSFRGDLETGRALLDTYKVGLVRG